MWTQFDLSAMVAGVVLMAAACMLGVAMAGFCGATTERVAVRRDSAGASGPPQQRAEPGMRRKGAAAASVQKPPPPSWRFVTFEARYAQAAMTCSACACLGSLTALLAVAAVRDSSWGEKLDGWQRHTLIWDLPAMLWVAAGVFGGSAALAAAPLLQRTLPLRVAWSRVSSPRAGAALAVACCRLAALFSNSYISYEGACIQFLSATVVIVSAAAACWS